MRIAEVLDHHLECGPATGTNGWLEHGEATVADLGHVHRGLGLHHLVGGALRNDPHSQCEWPGRGGGQARRTHIDVDRFVGTAEQGDVGRADGGPRRGHTGGGERIALGTGAEVLHQERET